MSNFTTMTKEFKYCENPEAEVPRLFIDKEIGGKDADGIPNIDGNVFLKELMYLSDILGKPRIEVWINSPGGIVTEGQSIYASILNCKATVDTICYGIAASIAGVDFQAGKKRIMLDYSHLMYHPAWSEDGKKDKGLEALNHGICTMIAKRTGKTEDEIWAIMNRGRIDDKGTWINAKEALEMGFCDEVRDSDAMNKIDDNTLQSIWSSANKVLNRINEQKPKKMKLVLNKLGLNEEASEASAVVALDILNKSMEDLKKQYDIASKKCDDLKAEMEEMKKKAKADEDSAKAKAEEEDKKAKVKKSEDEDKNATDTIAKAVVDGKIKNDAKLIASYKAMFIANPEVTKALIEELPVTKISPTFNSATGTPATEGSIKDTPAEAAARAAGLKPGDGKWYNAVKINELQLKNK